MCLWEDMNISQWKNGDRTFFSLEVDDRLLLVAAVSPPSTGHINTPADVCPGPGPGNFHRPTVTISQLSHSLMKMMCWCCSDNGQSWFPVPQVISFFFLMMMDTTIEHVPVLIISIRALDCRNVTCNFQQRGFDLR